ncbi:MULTISPECIES: GbsR/MarR family transcriptional regulator [Paenibacillus]|uniref:GbsR/MarR family transcriptional regulator n=1 Tax=Paenibacillus TaxID=44249 RepID=UPI00088E6048|nr:MULTISPECIES: hypothetical protein [Paenibacillus]NTZ18391.1 hypothetical protein [Paenibacillus sp. JMULE4]GCL72697.1 hypothetical protein PN4B1_26240 [Paenibacillus naphthalenovorans]SDJ54899.1 DNA-binding transcriptional regulator GbsR, MarR family [Paenibacillus naphthalenovorans]
MNSKPQSFAELKQAASNHLSLSFETDGFSPLVGRIFALLLFAPEPLSLQEMADELGVTKAAVSVQVRALEKHCMCQKIPTGNDRKDYYYIAEDFSTITLRTMRHKVESITKQVDESLTILSQIDNVTEEEQASFQVTKRRFIESAAMYRLVMSRLEGIEEEWIRIREQL